MLRKFIEIHLHRFILWSPVAMMLGIAAYFSLANEPYYYAGVRLVSGSVFLLLIVRRWPFAQLFATAVCLVALGFYAAQFRAYHVATPLLGQEIHNRMVEGTVDEIEPVDQKIKLVISHPAIENISQNETPLRLRVSFRDVDSALQVGDQVRFTANLYPLPAPTMPGGYEFARHFYFRSIGGNGYAMHAPEIIQSTSPSTFSGWMNGVRHTTGERIRSGIAGSAGTVAAAMTVGEPGPIPENIKNILRDSGLAHMLAIAGLHLGIVAGIVFYVVRLCLALYPPFALRLPIKKIAAGFGLSAAFIYLLLAGFPVPAQRAFIMVSILFMGMILDRRGITLRTLMIAAMVILLLFPEAMFGASFQMSFAATLAIVSLYEGFGGNLFQPDAPWWTRIWHHLLGIIFTSLSATLATAPFVLYHFNRFAIFGLIANSVVVPLATFVIMPGMVLSLLLMPFGLEWIGYAPLAFGTNIMIQMAAWVTSLPYSSLHLASPTDFGLALSSFGLLFLCLMQTRWRLLGGLFILAGVVTIALHVPVDAFISDDARQVMVRLPDGNYTALKGTERAVTTKNWLRSEGRDDIVPLNETGIICDTTQCRYEKNGRSMIFVKTQNALLGACKTNVDVLIAWEYLHRDTCPAPKMLIGRGELEEHGAHELRFTENGVRVAVTRESAHGRRLWQPDYSYDSDQEY